MGHVGVILWATSSGSARAKQRPTKGTGAQMIVSCSMGQRFYEHHAVMGIKSAWDSDTVSPLLYKHADCSGDIQFCADCQTKPDIALTDR